MKKINNKKMGFIGGGAMAEAMVKGILKAELMTRQQLYAYDCSAERMNYLQKKYAINIVESEVKLISEVDILLIAVKPQNIKAVLEGLKGIMRPEILVMSIVAGASLAMLEGKLVNTPVVRLMPNTPAMVGEAMTAIVQGHFATGEHIEIVKDIFNAVGRTIVVDESAIDAVTGLSGSGPGYVFVFLDALASAGIRVGLNRETAMLLAAQTLYGSAKMVLETGEHPSKLRDDVSSAGGTTITGIHLLEKGAFRGLVMDAVVAATERSKEMSDKK